MKKLINTAFVYVIAGALGGVFFREFTKFNGFTGKTALSYVHPHLIGLGSLVFLLLALFANMKDFTGDKKFRHFYLVYNIGLAGMNVMFLVRGILDVTGGELSGAVNASVSGVAGIFHICMFAGLYRLVSLLKQNFAGQSAK